MRSMRGRVIHVVLAQIQEWWVDELKIKDVSRVIFPFHTSLTGKKKKAESMVDLQLIVRSVVLGRFPPLEVGNYDSNSPRWSSVNQRVNHNWGVQTALRDNHPRGTGLFDPTSYPYFEQYLIKTDNVGPLKRNSLT